MTGPPLGYLPVQPLQFSAQTKLVCYQELPPHPTLRPWVACYWRLSGLPLASHAFEYRVVADGCIDLFWDERNPSEAWITAASQAPTAYKFAAEFAFAGIRFLPVGFSSLFGCHAMEMGTAACPVAALIPGFASQIAGFFERQMDWTDVCKLMDAWLCTQVQKSRPPDPRLMEALQLMYRANGQLLVDENLGIGLSPRQLRRLFEEHVGTSPKMLAQILRFQSLLRQDHLAPLKQKDYLLLYADQPHFTKQFQRFSGMRPSNIL